MALPHSETVLALPDAEFARLGLAFKARALRAAAAAFLEFGQKWAELDPSELVDEVQSVPRIGPWTAGASVADLSNDYALYPFADLVRFRARFAQLTVVELGIRVRDLFADGSSAAARVRSQVDDSYLATLASAVTGGLGGKVGVAPRLFLRKLVLDVLDRVEQFDDFDPRRHYALTISDRELTEVERQAAHCTNNTQCPDDFDLDV